MCICVHTCVSPDVTCVYIRIHGCESVYGDAVCMACAGERVAIGCDVYECLTCPVVAKTLQDDPFWYLALQAHPTWADRQERVRQTDEHRGIQTYRRTQYDLAIHTGKHISVFTCNSTSYLYMLHE